MERVVYRILMVINAVGIGLGVFLGITYATSHTEQLVEVQNFINYIPFIDLFTIGIIKFCFLAIGNFFGLMSNYYRFSVAPLMNVLLGIATLLFGLLPDLSLSQFLSGPLTLLAIAQIILGGLLIRQALKEIETLHFHS